MPKGISITARQRIVALTGALWILPAASPCAAAEAPDARDKTLPCRPTIACTADIVPPGTFDFEAGALYRSLGVPGGATTTRQWTFPFLAKLTLEGWVQLQVGSNGLTLATGFAPQNYFDDVIVGPKFHLFDQTDWLPSISFSVEVSVPTFPGQGYLRTYDTFVTTYVTKDLGPVHADFNAGGNLWRVGGSPLPQALLALALSANLPPPFGVMGEVYYFSNAPPVAPRDGGLLFAFTHSPRSWLVFDLGADVGWFPSSRAYSVFVGASIIPVVLWRPASAAQASH
jgi:hypothetical protein